MLMLNRAFFSLQSNWIPTWVALGNLGLNAVLDFAFYRFGTWGIPLATAVCNVVSTAVLVVLLRARLGRMGGTAIAGALGKIVTASVLLAPACASYDMFKSFEERGSVFKDSVRRLAAEAAKTCARHGVKCHVRHPRHDPSRLHG